VADLLDRLHYDAALDLLRAVPNLTVFPDAEGFTPINPPTPYVRVYLAIDRQADAGGNSLAGVSQAWTTRVYCHCVGATEYAAIAVQMLVRSGLLDVRPVIAGRNCGPWREEQATPPARDEGTGVVAFDAISVYRLKTN